MMGTKRVDYTQTSGWSNLTWVLCICAAWTTPWTKYQIFDFYTKVPPAGAPKFHRGSFFPLSCLWSCGWYDLVDLCIFWPLKVPDHTTEHKPFYLHGSGRGTSRLVSDESPFTLSRNDGWKLSEMSRRTLHQPLLSSDKPLEAEVLKPGQVCSVNTELLILYE